MAPTEREREVCGAPDSSTNDDDVAAAATAAPSTSTPSSPSPPSSSSLLSRLGRPPPFRVLLSEASGAVGDLGTFLPLTLGLVSAVGLDFSTTLLFTGFYNIASGLAFGIPMPVQPMKTIAAIAVASASSSSSSSSSKVTLEEVMAAGMFVSSAVLVLGATGLAGVVNRCVPRAVVAGLQLGVGLKLASSGVKAVFLVQGHKQQGQGQQQQQQPQGKNAGSLGWRPAAGVEGWILGAAALAFLFVSTVKRESGAGEGEEERRSLLSSRSSSLAPSSPSSLSSPSVLPGGGGLHEAFFRRKKLREGGDHESGGSGGSRSGGSGNSSNSNGGGDEASATAEPPLLVALAPNACPSPSSSPPPLAPAPAPAPPAPPQSAWQLPSALLVTFLGVALAFASAPAAARSALHFGPSRVSAAVPTASDWRRGITSAGGLAQLPLTTLNSVIAVSQLADHLYGNGGNGNNNNDGNGNNNGRNNRYSPSRWRPSRIAVAVGAYNLVGGWFGAVPVCTGSGGLAALSRFGARSGAAPALLGAAEVALALALGSSLSAVLRYFPSGMLGAMLALAGAELAAASRASGGGSRGGSCGSASGRSSGGDSSSPSTSTSAALSSSRFFAFAALTAAAILGLDDPAAGFAVGLGLWICTDAWERGSAFLKEKWRRSKREATTTPTSERSQV